MFDIGRRFPEKLVVRCGKVALLALCGTLPFRLAAASDVYLDVMEKAVSAYSDDRLMRYVGDVEREGVQEHGFPRLAANMAVLVANGRLTNRREVLRRMMTCACRDAARGKMPPKSGGNEFSVKELSIALRELERARAFPGETLEGWKAALREVKAERCYSVVPKLGNEKHGYNWCVFGAASEQARLAMGLGGDGGFVERYVADQIRWFDENGMYRDPHEPAVYDLVTRLQFAAILHYGYDGPSREKLESLLDRSAEPTLKMLSACGEIPYGGRSNQFLHNHTFYAALSEWYAQRYAARGDRVLAARFKAAAHRAITALQQWLAVKPLRHVKNLYPVDSGIGCEKYAYFDKYMVTMGSWAMLAREFANEVKPQDPPVAPDVFITSPQFHWVFLSAGDYSAQFDYAANAQYDCDGLGRLHRRGAPPQICLSTPCAKDPRYRLAAPNERDLAIMPVADAKLALAASGKDEKSAWAEWKAGDLVWRCRLSDAGLTMKLTGSGDVALSLPAFAFDGETWTKIETDKRGVSIAYRNWTCRFTTDGVLRDTGLVAENRNGRYRVMEACGKRSLRVTVTILRTDDVCRGRGPDPERVAAIAKRLPARPAWLDSPYKGHVKKAERYIRSEIPDCSDELYLLTSKTGNRSRYQDVCFERLRRLTVLAGAARETGEERLVRRVVDYLEAICAERSWTLPAHDRALSNFNGRKLTIDLGSSHRALTLAGVIAQLGDKLPEEVRRRVMGELERRIFSLYRATNRVSGDDKAVKKLGNWWFTGGNNWNAVCHSCVVRAALAVLEDRADRAAFVEAAERAMRIFLSEGFLDDGYCTEGMGYWNYGYGHFLELALAVRTATDGFVDLSRLPRAKTPMEYASGYTLDGTRCPVFADGGGGRASAAALGNASRLWPEFKDFARRPLPLRTVFPKAQVYIGRAPRLAVGLKGGNNAELHNHNDIGSWSLLADGKLVAGDPGGEIYTARTFSKDRYVSDVLNSYGHPVPLVNGEKQLVGSKSQARLVTETFSDDRDVVAFDISDAYPATRGKRGAVVREVTFDRAAQAVAIADRFHVESPLPFESVMISPLEKCPLVPEVAGGVWHLEEKKLENPGKASPYRTAVVFDGPVAEATVTWRYATSNP